MLKKLLLALSVFSYGLVAQQSQTFISPTPIGVTSGNVSVVGNSGNASYYYWIIAKFPRGNASHSPVLTVINAPNQLTTSNYVRVNWNPVSGATGYDVIRTNSNNFPSSGNIAIATNISQTSLLDKGLALSAYTVSTIPVATETWYLDNQNCSNPIIQMPSVYGTSGLVCSPPFLRTSQLGGLFQTSNNLSEGTPATMRSNLGLGDIATSSSSTYFKVSNNLSETFTPNLIRNNLGLTSTAITPLTNLFQVSNNLSEGNAATIRSNIGLTNTATTPLTNLFQVANNLSEGNASVIRNNLGLSSTATTPLANLLQIGSTFTGVVNNTIHYANNSGILSQDTKLSYNGLALSSPHLAGSSPTPTVTTNTALTGTVTITSRGTDTAGLIQFTTGSTVPAASIGGILTVTFTTAYPTSPFCVITAGNYPAIQTNSGEGSSTASFTIFNNSSLVANTTYIWLYVCVQ